MRLSARPHIGPGALPQLVLPALRCLPAVPSPGRGGARAAGTAGKLSSHRCLLSHPKLWIGLCTTWDQPREKCPADPHRRRRPQPPTGMPIALPQLTHKPTRRTCSGDCGSSTEFTAPNTVAHISTWILLRTQALGMSASTGLRAGPISCESTGCRPVRLAFRFGRKALRWFCDCRHRPAPRAARSPAGCGPEVAFERVCDVDRRDTRTWRRRRLVSPI